MIDPHRCHVRGCDVEVRKELLCCSFHWGLVPWNLRREVLRNYRPGQCDDKSPSDAWIRAAKAALSAAEEAEKKARKIAE